MAVVRIDDIVEVGVFRIGVQKAAPHCRLDVGVVLANVISHRRSTVLTLAVKLLGCVPVRSFLCIRDYRWGVRVLCVVGAIEASGIEPTSNVNQRPMKNAPGNTHLCIASHWLEYRMLPSRAHSLD
jgi:hypothetical protein